MESGHLWLSQQKETENIQSIMTMAVEFWAGEAIIGLARLPLTAEKKEYFLVLSIKNVYGRVRVLSVYFSFDQIWGTNPGKKNMEANFSTSH